MEKKRGNQVMAIAALFIAVIGLSLGFAAFSNTLTISSSATVNPDASSAFDVNLSTQAASTQAGSVTAYLNPKPVASTYNATNYTAGTATISNPAAASAGQTSNASITGIKANFTEPGQTVTYVFYARNDGHLTAFLNGVTFADASEGGSPIECEAASNYPNGTSVGSTAMATDSLVESACDGISVSVTVGGTVDTSNAATTGAVTVTSGNEFTGSVADNELKTTNKSLAIGASTPVVVKIMYASGDTYRVDGPMDVSIGDITLTYGSVDGDCTGSSCS